MLYMPTHKSNDYKLTAVQYYLVEDKTKEEVCKIFKCSSRSFTRHCGSNALGRKIQNRWENYWL